MLQNDKGPDVPRVIEGGGAGTVSWADVVEASAAAQEAVEGAPDEAAPAPVATSGEPSEEARPHEQACDDVLSVLLAATGPLDLETIAAEVNIDRTKPHLPKGVVETLLHGALCGKVTRSEEGDPTRFHYALTPVARADIEAPGVVREALAAVVAALAGQTDYMPRSGPAFTTELSAEQVAFALHAARANADDRPFMPEGWVESFFRGIDPRDPRAVADATRERLTVLSSAGHVLATAPDAGSDEPVTFRLTGNALVLFADGGATAVVASMYPPKPVGPTPAEIDALVEAQVKARVDPAVAEAERSAALFKRHWEESVADLAAVRAQVIAYERWFTAKHLPVPKAVLLAGAVERPEPRDVFEYEQERPIDHDELLRIIGEERRLTQYIAEFTEAAASRKADDAAEIKKLTVKVEGLRVAMGRAATTGTHVVLKKAYNVVRNGKLVTLSADPHDQGEVLAEEDLPGGTQLEVPGAKGGDPTWTPTASPAAATPAPAATPATPTGSIVDVVFVETPPAAPEPAKIEAPPATGPIELTVKTVLPVMRAMVQHPIHHGGLLGLGGVATALCSWTGMARSQKMDTLLAKLVPQMVKAGDLCQGEGGLDTLYWGPAFEDPRKAGGEPTSGPAPTKAAKKTRKAAPAPSADPRPEAAKKAAPKAPAGKAKGRAKK